MFLKIRSNNNRNTVKNPLSNSLKFGAKVLNVNHKPQKKGCKELIHKDAPKGSLTNNVYQNTLNVLNEHSKRTSELVEKIRNKEKLMNKLGLSKKPISIQKMIEKINKNKKGKMGLKDIKLNTIQNEDDNKENHIINLTERNEDIFNKIQKITCDIKVIETKINDSKKETNTNNNTKPNSVSVQFVDEYQDDIWDTLIIEQSNFMPKAGYMSTIQKDITERMRYILLDWILEVHLKFKLRPETFYLTVNIIDRYLSKVSINRKYLQLLGITALFSASKYEEIYSPEAKDLVYMCDSAYKKPDLINMENKVLHELNFDLTINSPLKYLDFFIIFLHLNDCSKIIVFTQFLCELCYMSYDMIKYNPCFIATTSLYISCLTYGKFEDKFYQDLVTKSQIKLSDVICCAKDLISNLNKVRFNKYNAIISKYKKAKFLSVVNDNLWNLSGKFIVEDIIMNKKE